MALSSAPLSPNDIANARVKHSPTMLLAMLMLTYFLNSLKPLTMEISMLFSA